MESKEYWQEGYSNYEKDCECEGDGGKRGAVSVSLSPLMGASFLARCFRGGP